MYVGYGDWNFYPACILASYDPVGNVWRCESAPGTDALGVFREIDGSLYASHCDPIHYEDFKDYSYFQPGYGWRDRTPLGLYHAFDFCKMGTDLFFCGAKDSHEGSPNTTTNNGLLMRSQDGGKSWASVNPTSNGYSRYYWCFTLNGKVYTLGGYWNGSAWTNGSPLASYSYLYKPTVVPTPSGSLMVGLASRIPGSATTATSSLVTFNGTTITSLSGLVYDFTWDGSDFYALRSDGIYKGTITAASTISWELVSITAIPSTATCIEVMDNCAWVGDGNGGLWRQLLDGNTLPTNSTPTVSVTMPDGFGRSVVFDGTEVLASAYEAPQMRISDGVIVPTAGKVSSWMSQGAIENRNWSSVGNILPPTPKISGWFGKDLSVNNGILGVVEAGYEAGLSADRGSAARVHLYVRGVSNWQSHSILNIPFAQSVAVDSNLLVVGSSNPAANQAAGKPSLYPYSITRTANLAASSFTAKPGIGPVVNNWGYKPVARSAISTNYIMGGFSGDISRNGGIGMISLWNRAAVAAATTTAPAPIQEISTVLPDRYGMAITLTDSYAAVGAPRDDTTAKQAGAVYVYDVTAASQPLVQRQRITCPVAQAEAGFGSSVAIHGNTLLVGAPGVDVGGIIGRGKVYIYRLSGSVWSLVGELLPPYANEGGFGIEVAINASWMSAGSRYSKANAAFTDRMTLMPTLAAQADAYTAWANANTIPPANQPENLDPDGDKIPNLIEYAAGLDPQNATLPTLTENGTELAGLPLFFVRPGVGPVLRYLSRPADLRLRQEIEISSDLKNWTVIRPSTVSTVAGNSTLSLNEAALPPLPVVQTGYFARVRYERQVP